MAKNLDGIKKLNAEEIKENRKIVLSYIGEKDSELAKEPKALSRIASAINRVDGIKLNRISSLKFKAKNMFDGAAPLKDGQAGKLEKINLEKDRIGKEKTEQEELAKKEIRERAKREAEEARKWREKLRLEENEKKEKLIAKENRRLEGERAKQIKIEREEFVKKEMAEKARREVEEKAKAEEAVKKFKEEELAKKEIRERAKREAEEKTKAEEARKWREKLRLEEKKKEEKRIMRENERLEKIKRAEEVKKIKQEIKLAKIADAGKRKIKRQKAVRLFKKNLKNKLSGVISSVKQNFVYGILYLFMFLIIGYAVFCLLVLRFKIDDNIIGEMARILPVPAVITSQGIINYNDFRDIKNNYANLNSVEKKNNLAKWIIFKNLTKKYGLPVNSSGQALALAFSTDRDFNQVGLSRIEKISQLSKNIEDIGQLSKYADEYSQVIYYDSASATEKFGQSVFNLNAGQVSEVIFSHNGYYIIQAAENKNGQLGIKYLFVAAKILDQYVGEKLSKIKIFILAN